LTGTIITTQPRAARPRPDPPQHTNTALPSSTRPPHPPPTKSHAAPAPLTYCLPAPAQLQTRREWPRRGLCWLRHSSCWPLSHPSVSQPHLRGFPCLHRTQMNGEVRGANRAATIPQNPVRVVAHRTAGCTHQAAKGPL